MEEQDSVDREKLPRAQKPSGIQVDEEKATPVPAKDGTRFMLQSVLSVVRARVGRLKSVCREMVFPILESQFRMFLRIERSCIADVRSKTSVIRA